jgi:iron only hydrogenase large subunit-like protein
VLETSLGAELMMMEQVEVFKERADEESGWPLMTSSCPAWVQFVEQSYPELIPKLSPLKSPQQILGALIKQWYPMQPGNENKEVVSVVITSCTAAKTEARRVEMTKSGIPVIDLVLTTRELGRLIKLSGLDLDRLEPEQPDAPFNSPGSAGKLCGVAGGEVEATIRSLYGNLSGKELPPAKLHRFRIHKSFREMGIKVGDKEVTMGTVSGLSNTVALLKEIKSGKRKIDLLEVMACPDGCINGGGQPLPVDEKMLRNRSKAVYDIDNSSILHTAHQSQAIQKIYKEILGEPGGVKSHEMLYTSFTKREVLL